ncbi:unnamed protein product, partial [Symbiodinium pilosum]
FNACMGSMRKASRWRRAHLLLTQFEMASLQTDLRSFSVASSACSRSRHWQQAVELVTRQMHSGLQPDRVSFALWLNQCCCATFNINWDRSAFEAASACSTSDWMRTIHVFHQMASMQVRLDVANGNTALNSCEKAAAWITGLALLQHLPQAATSADAVTFNSAVSACRGYNAAITALGRALQSERAVELLRTVSSCKLKVDLLSFSSAISACQRLAKWRPAVYLFKSLRDDSIAADSICCRT